MVTRATFAGAILMVMMAWVTNVQQLVILRFLHGVFTGTIGPPRRWGKRRRNSTRFTHPRPLG